MAGHWRDTGGTLAGHRAPPKGPHEREGQAAFDPAGREGHRKDTTPSHVDPERQGVQEPHPNPRDTHKTST